MSFLQIIGIGAVLLSAPDAVPCVTVTVRAASDVPGRVFTIGEIAEVSGTDRKLAEQVKAVEAGTSPLPGLTRMLTEGDIVTRLRFNHLDPKSIKLVCPPTIRIARGGSEVAAADIIRVATAALMAARKGKDDGATIEPAQLPARMFVAPGKQELQAGAPRGVLEAGTAVVPVTVMVDGKPAKTVDVPFRMKRTATAVLAKHVLEPHHVLTEDDLTVGEIELAPGAQTPLSDLHAALGKRTARQIAQGAALTANAVESAPAILTGAKVTVEIVVGGVHISAPAIARGQAAVGEPIRVFCVDTKRDMTGVIVDATTVRVEGE